MIKPIALSATHMECRSLEESVPVLTDLLAFEKLTEKPGEVKLKHPNTDWVLYVHETGGEAPVKQMHNHWGVRVATTGESTRPTTTLYPRRKNMVSDRLLSRCSIMVLIHCIFSSRVPTAGRSSVMNRRCEKSPWLGKPAASMHRIGRRLIRRSDFLLEAMFLRLLRTALWPARTWKRRASSTRVLLGWKPTKPTQTSFTSSIQTRSVTLFAQGGRISNASHPTFVLRSL